MKLGRLDPRTYLAWRRFERLVWEGHRRCEVLCMRDGNGYKVHTDECRRGLGEVERLRKRMLELGWPETKGFLTYWRGM